MTDQAAIVLSRVRSSRGLPEHFGVRIAHGASSNGQQPIHVGFSEAPAEGDEEMVAEGVRLFVAPEVSEPFDGFLLDAVESEEGVSLVLREPA
jgi:Fe-S cluster assembly iron-binding protein IscA